jgi:diaminopimelate epimerase
MLVYERDCGITRACSSGAVASIQTLFKLNKISQNQNIIISMPGGNLHCSIKNNAISITAPANHIFSGNIELD